MTENSTNKKEEQIDETPTWESIQMHELDSAHG